MRCRSGAHVRFSEMWVLVSDPLQALTVHEGRLEARQGDLEKITEGSLVVVLWLMMMWWM